MRGHASSAGNDAGELEPMANSIRRPAGKVPEAMLVDGGFTTRANVEPAHAEVIVWYAPLKEEAKQLREEKDPYAAKMRDGAAMKEFRARTGQAEPKARYACRGSTAKRTNAQARNANLYAVRVQGVKKAQAVLVLWALSHNLLRPEARRRQPSQTRVEQGTPADKAPVSQKTSANGE